MNRKTRELSLCIQCGTCTAACPSGRFTALRVRRLVRQAQEKNKVEDLWSCTTCYNCQERCPRGIELVETVYALRREAVKRGEILSPHMEVYDCVRMTGHAVPIDDEHKDKRRRVGLPELPGTTHKYPAALAEVRRLLEAAETG